jgi:DNA-binding transcriptional regulator YhcF (GntR family)
MLHKRYDLEIIEILRKQPTHIREMAKTLKLGPYTTMRAFKMLRNENAVDFIKEGRNSKYVVKGTLESDQYLALLEDYKVLKCLENPTLRRIISEIRRRTNGEVILLFGN